MSSGGRPRSTRSPTWARRRSGWSKSRFSTAGRNSPLAGGRSELARDVELRDRSPLVEGIVDPLERAGGGRDVREVAHLDRVRQLVGPRPGELERSEVETPSEAVRG